MFLAVFEEHLGELFFVLQELSLVGVVEETGADLRVSYFNIFMNTVSFELREHSSSRC